MKKSTILLMHVSFWIIIILTRVLYPLLTKIPIGENEISSIELSRILIAFEILSPAFFYMGYFGIMLINRKLRTVLIIGSTYILFSLILYFVSTKLFVLLSFGTSSTVILWFAIGSLFRFFVDWFKKRDENLRLEKENLLSRLKNLRSQINPHFLFNTLNNIDALILSDKIKASESIEKLSGIMRYMLNENENSRVELEKEISLLKDYISLERLRLKNEKYLSFRIRGDYKGLIIAPMLLLSFIENAFKHATGLKDENGIRMDISVEGNNLRFRCENDFEELKIPMVKSEGIGLETVKERLSLIYPNSHKLEISKNANVFKVDLEIELNEN